MKGFIHYCNKLVLTISHKIATVFWYRQTFFFLITALSILIVGYHFGTFDQASHIPFLKKLADPTLYPNDPFFSLQRTHYSYFWYFFIPVLKAKILEPITFLVYCMSIYLTFVGIYRISQTLFKNNLASFFSVLICVLPHIGVTGLPIIEFSLVNRVFVLPFLLFAIDFYLNKRYWLAFLILGICFNLHALSVIFLLGMFFLDSLLEWKNRTIFWFLKYLIIFSVVAWPVLVWKFQQPDNAGAYSQLWYEILRHGLLSNIFNLFSFHPPVIILTIAGLSSLGVVFLRTHNRIIRNFMLAIVLFIVVQIISSLIHPIALVIELQVVRAGFFSLLFCYLYAAEYAAIVFGEKGYSGIDRYSKFFLALISVTPILLFIDMLFPVRKYSFVTKIFIILTFFLYIPIGIGAYAYGVWQPGIFITIQKSDDVDVAMWAKNNTPKASLFIAPPYWWWNTGTEWRVVSERGTIAVYSELLEVAFTPSYIPIWKERFSDIAPGALDKFYGDQYQDQKTTRNAYLSLSFDQVITVAKKYKASYFVTEKQKLYPFPVIYENSTYRVYDLTKE